MLQDRFAAPYELIHIPDAQSLCEGYNRGASKARGDILVFCHDDISILCEDVAPRLRSALQRYDLVGVAGTSKLVSGKWVGAGFPYLHGHICHGSPDHHAFTYLNYGCGKDPHLVDQVQALDGVFFATKRQVWEQVAFDAQTFDGFHLYDLDFTFRAFLAGYRLAVDYGLQLLHFSSGQFDHKWNRYKYLFQKKFKGHLFEPDEKSLPYYRAVQFSTLDACRASMVAPDSLICVGFDPDSLKPHFRCVAWDQLENLKQPVRFWEVSEADMNPLGDAANAFYKMAEHSSSGALIHWQGSAHAFAKLEAWVQKVSQEPQPFLVKVAGRSQPSGHLLLRVNKPMDDQEGMP